MTRRTNSLSTFTNEERARLRSYRRAIRAGFYSDWDGSASVTDTETLAWLGAPRARQPEDDAKVENEGAPFPFTPSEVARLERCRAMVNGGYYSENLGTASTPPG
jgi:hypothetical protein